MLTRERGKWETLRKHSGFDWANWLSPVYENGNLCRDDNFEDIRNRSNWTAMD